MSLKATQTGPIGVPGKTLTLDMRFRAPAAQSDLAVLRDATSQPIFALSIKQVDTRLQLEFTLRTDQHEVLLHVGIPISLIAGELPGRELAVLVPPAPPYLGIDWAAVVALAVDAVSSRHTKRAYTKAREDL